MIGRRGLCCFFHRNRMALLRPSNVIIIELLVLISLLLPAESGDTNPVFSPCADTTVRASDGFSFGIAFASREAFFYNGPQLSPCDSRLALASNSSQLSVFRPKVDEISLLTINTSSSLANYGGGGGYMVAFAGRKYAARSYPIFVANGTYTITSFTLVLEFNRGRLENLYWKRDGCSKCTAAGGSSGFVCLDNQQACAIRSPSCKNNGGGGSVDCSLGIQLAFSGTDKHLSVFNSWYQVHSLRQYSLYALYSNLKDSLTAQYDTFF